MREKNDDGKSSVIRMSSSAMKQGMEGPQQNRMANLKTTSLISMMTTNQNHQRQWRRNEPNLTHQLLPSVAFVEEQPPVPQQPTLTCSPAMSLLPLSMPPLAHHRKKQTSFCRRKQTTTFIQPTPAQISPVNFERNEFDAQLLFCRNASSTVESKEQQ
jgi:hypothetical protein